MRADSLRGRQFLLTTTMLVAALTGYGRRAYGACVAGTPPNFVCSGANNTQQTITANDATVSTIPGFSVITGNTSGVSVSGDGALSYTDVNASTLAGGTFGLYMRSNADIVGGNPGSVTVTTNGDTTGGFAGIGAINVGSGAVNITTNGDSTGTGFSSAGVYTRNFGVDSFITTGAGTTAKANSYGILARHYGVGVLDIKANGDSTGTNVDGIYGLNLNGTDFNITTGVGTTVSGRLAGIRALNYGTGALDVQTNGDVSATTRFGIYAKNKPTGTDVSVTTGVGTTTYGFITGIRALNYGTGALSVTANGDVTGQTVSGIFAQNSAGGTDLTVTTGAGADMFGGRFGIYAANNGAGALSVTTGGDVTGTLDQGITALNGANGTDLSVTTGVGTTTTGGNYGIRAVNSGTGALTVTADGDASGGFIGIHARNSANGTDLSVTSNGDVTGPQFGIRALNDGSGATSVTANGDVTGADAFGIYARNSANGADLDVAVGADANITASSTAILVRNYGGDLSVTTGVGSNVTGTTYTGIAAENLASGANLDVTTGANSITSGNRFGISAKNNGAGALTIIANGDTNGTTDTAIYALNTGNGTALAVTTGEGSATTGGFNGIVARNEGTGAASVTANGDVYGGMFEGIFASNAASGTGLTVTSGAASSVNGVANGMNVRNYGTGALTITADGDVTGLGGAVQVGPTGVGIYAQNFAGTSLGVTTGASSAVSGLNHGIFARNYGTGAFTVTANGETAGDTFDGIYARQGAAGTSMSVTTGTGSSTTGGRNGISARNYGTGAMSVTANGDVTGTDAAGYGIYARNYNGTDLNIATGPGSTVTGGDTGIDAFNLGTGDMIVTLNGDATGTNFGGAELFNFGEDMVVTTGFGTTMSGPALGLRASNNGTGDTTVNVNGDATATIGTALYAVNFSNANDLNLTTGIASDVSGSGGIFSRSFGTGDMTITANGDVTGTLSTGIQVRNYAKDVTVNTGAFSSVTGGTYGILVRNEGTGALEINANGDVAGEYRNGIFALNTSTSTEGLTVTTGPGSSVTGRTIGIGALNYGIGGLTVTANGDVAGTTNVGIYARNDGGSTGDLTVTTGPGSSVSSDTYGIFTRNFVNTALSITANGDVTGTARDGIHAENYGTDLSIATGTGTSVTGGAFGIRALNYGTGTLSVTADGDVSSDGIGIYARNGTSSAPSGTDVDVATGIGTSVSGATGIRARNYGAGALTVTANGDTTGTAGDGIFAANGSTLLASGTDLSVTTGAGSSATGSFAGIGARNYGTGTTRVDANGDASGNWYGIYATSKSTAADLTVTTGAGTTTTGGVHGIRALNQGTGALTVTANGDTTGTDEAGIYARHANGGPIDVTVGAGATAQGGASGVHISAGAQNSLTNYGTVRNLDGITGVAIVGGTGSERVDNFGLVTGDVLLGTGVNAFNNMQGGLFESGAQVAIGAGNTLTNAGALSPGGTGSVFATALTGNFVQTAAGQYVVDIEGAEADRVDGSGSATVDGKVRPNYTLASLGSSRQWTVLTATSPIVDNGIRAVSTPVVQFDVIFPTATQMDLVVDVDFAVSGLNRNETAIANNLTAIFDTGKFAKMDAALNAIAFLPSAAAVANALDQLSPEIYLDTEIGMLYAAQTFTNSLMTCPTYDGAAAFIKEGQCVWARVAGRSFSQDTTFETLGIDETSFQIAGGVQGALGDAWRIGFAGAFEQGRLDTSTNAQSDFDRGHAGAVVKYNPGPLLLAAAVSGGWGWYETTRQIAFPGFSSLATSDHQVGYLDGRFRAAYLFTNGTWYAKPIVDLDATRLDLDDVSERATGGVGLKVRGNDETVLSATPALELGMQFGTQGGTLFRPYVRGGATFLDDPNFTLLASFEGSPSGVGPFRIATETDDVVAVVAAGIDVVGASGASFRLYYDGRFGETVEANEGGIKASLAF